MRCCGRVAGCGIGRCSKRWCSAGSAAARSSACDSRISTARSRRVFIVDGKGGHQRHVPITRRWFATVGDYLMVERPDTDTDRVFVVLKGQRRGRPLSVEGLNQVFVSARERAGLRRVTCHQLRHTCFTRLREAGMELEALQVMAGHRSIETTRLYIHLANEWLAEEYERACAVIDADLFIAAADGIGR